MSENIKRYDPIEYYQQGGSSLGTMNEVEDGEWVRHEDHQRELAAALAENEKLKGWLETETMNREEFERLQAELAAANARIAELAEKSDKEMLRVKACEHIAEGLEGWESVRNECPSTAAVASLRDAFAVAQQKQEQRDGKWLDRWGCCKVCDGEIPHGHMPTCDLFKLEQENENLQHELTTATARLHVLSLGKEAGQIISQWREQDGGGRRDVLFGHLQARIQAALDVANAARDEAQKIIENLEAQNRRYIKHGENARRALEKERDAAQIQVAAMREFIESHFELCNCDAERHFTCRRCAALSTPDPSAWVRREEAERLGNIMTELLKHIQHTGFLSRVDESGIMFKLMKEADKALAAFRATTKGAVRAEGDSSFVDH